MSTPTFDPTAYKAAERRDWDRVAAGWEKWWPTFERGAQRLSDRMVDLAELRPGHKVLDVATGIGEPALTAARRVGPTGRVTATDISPAMLDIARRRAAELGLSNVDVHEMDAEALEFPEGSFDAVLCRWGLMFFPGLDVALARIRRLLVPGGRFVAAVWGPREKVPMVSVTMKVLLPALQMPPPPPGAPDMFRLADGHVLEQTVARAGFHSIRTESIGVTLEWPSAEAYTQFRQETAAVTVALLAKCPPERKPEVLNGITEAAREYAAQEGDVRMPNESLCVTARA